MKPLLLAAVLAATAVATVAWTGLAYPHTHGTMTFDAFCCNGNRIDGDCQPIPATAVSYLSDGTVQVNLVPGDHPMVTKPHTYSMKQSAVRPSNDGNYYACLFPTEATLRCLYGPPFGM